MGNRYSAKTDEPTILEFVFKKNSVLTNAYSINRVTIHSSLADAEGDLNILQTISSVGISNTDVGYYSYTVPIIATAGTYYDKIFVTPVSSGTEVSYVNSYIITTSTYSGQALEVPSNPLLCRVTGTVTDGSGRVMGGVLVFCRPWVMPGTIQNNILGQNGLSAVSDTNGEFYIDLYKNIEYIFTIKETGLHSTIKIPDLNRYSITALITTGSATIPTSPGDTNW